LLGKLNFVSAKEDSHFVLEGLAFVMFGLVLDVGTDVRDLGETNGENAVTVLPCEIVKVRGFGL
jgi:hypothetical protein